MEATFKDSSETFNDTVTVRNNGAEDPFISVRTDGAWAKLGVVLTAEDAIALAHHITTLVAHHVPASTMIAWADVMKSEAKSRTAEAGNSHAKPQGYQALSPQSQMVLQHMRRAGSISVREAMNDYGIAGGTLARRIVDIEEAGFKVARVRKAHPITGRLYTRYSVVEA